MNSVGPDQRQFCGARFSMAPPCAILAGGNPTLTGSRARSWQERFQLTTQFVHAAIAYRAFIAPQSQTGRRRSGRLQAECDDACNAGHYVAFKSTPTMGMPTSPTSILPARMVACMAALVRRPDARARRSPRRERRRGWPKGGR